MAPQNHRNSKLSPPGLCGPDPARLAVQHCVAARPGGGTLSPDEATIETAPEPVAPKRPRSRVVIEAAGENGVYEPQSIWPLSDEATRTGGLLLAATGLAVMEGRLPLRSAAKLAALLLGFELGDLSKVSDDELDDRLLKRLTGGLVALGSDTGNQPVN